MSVGKSKRKLIRSETEEKGKSSATPRKLQRNTLLRAGECKGLSLDQTA